VSLSEIVRALVREIDGAWDGEAASFPALAYDVLTRAQAHRHAGLADMLAWLEEEGALPPQDLASGFGEPPITLHADGRWAVQLLAWVDGRTTIHEHDFAGAFTVLEGSSIERRFAFDGAEGGPLRLGRLSLLDVSLLPRGAVRPIEPGSALVHSVFHLDRPTLSLVIRTEGGLLEGPQYDYWAPHVALDPEHAEPRAVRQVQALAMLMRSGSAWQPFAASLLGCASLHHTFRILDLLLGMHDGGALPAELLELVAARHGQAAIEQILTSLQQGRWDHAVSARRATVSNAEHRFFLGVLLNAPDRERVLELVRARYPEPDVLARVRRWIGELVGRGEANAHPAVADLCERAAGAMMEGRTPADAASLLGPRAAAFVGDPTAFCTQLREGALRPLFDSA
jgi:hypothetical protein